MANMTPKQTKVMTVSGMMNLNLMPIRMHNSPKGKGLERKGGKIERRGMDGRKPPEHSFSHTEKIELIGQDRSILTALTKAAEPFTIYSIFRIRIHSRS